LGQPVHTHTHIHTHTHTHTHIYIAFTHIAASNTASVDITN